MEGLIGHLALDHAQGSGHGFKGAKATQFGLISQLVFGWAHVGQDNPLKSL